MSARSLIRHVFRHSSREKVSEDALPLGLRPGSAGDFNTEGSRAVYQNKQHTTTGIFTSQRQTPVPFGLEDITEEALVDTQSPTETASLTDSLASLELEISSFSTRELVRATLDEAKTATHAHIDTIDTTLALLDALDGFSVTISVLKQQMLGKKEAYVERMAMLEAVERALEGMRFAEEAQGQKLDSSSEE